MILTIFEDVDRPEVFILKFVIYFKSSLCKSLLKKIYYYGCEKKVIETYEFIISYKVNEATVTLKRQVELFLYNKF